MATMTRKAPTADEVKIDRTMVLDPSALWPDIESCPDWPIVSAANLQHMQLVTGKATAEARLDAIGRLLNRNARQLRAPTQTEREAEFDRVFDPNKAPLPRWRGLGLTFGPRKLLTEEEASLIVEAAHLRAYLRKLATQEAKRAEEAERLEAERAQRTLDGYADHQRRDLAELSNLSEAAARHEQRTADERAFRRVAEIRQSLSRGHDEAAQAARELGVEPPKAPQFD
ncbi:hypothetical protein [Citromicrobium sp. WPS32]|uniref:hypothetical protein n=1 Tax=Citromicrobium sp. WPS32 TaxID=1634517 RepID=UPI0006C8EE75|nr:hypothetical protein [Citromicrobium sp. WPS32]KPM13720.1 hypothetical protein WG75_11865 [Citromicrobium sp. WPS32]